MSIRLRNILFFSCSFLGLILLYWKAIQGGPIWDDTTFWFQDEVLKNSVTFSGIWKNYGWPLSISVQKILSSAFGTTYSFFHLFNLLLHFLNAALVYRLGRYLQLKHNKLFFLVFLLHPVAVITTAWMIQIKTLLCFFFCLSSLLSFLHGHKNLRWMILSWFLFACSVASKSAALTMPLIYLAISFRVNRFSKLHWLIPFFLISAWSSLRVLSSPVTIEGATKASLASTIKEEAPKITKTVAKEEKKKPQENKAPVIVPKPQPQPLQQTVPEKGATPLKPIPLEQNVTSFLVKYLKLDIGLVAQTMYYYFWQPLLPINNEPVKGLNHDRAGFTEILHLTFLLILIFIFRKDRALIYLGASHFLLIPFLGFYPAPFMSLTWVSDQHLYLVLPPILAFWFRILEKLKGKYVVMIPVMFLIFFSWKTYQASSFYKDQYSFFESSLEYNPMNVPIAYNLTMAYSMDGEWPKAYDVAKRTFELSLHEPVMQKNIYYPLLADYYFRLEKAMKPHAH